MGKSQRHVRCRGTKKRKAQRHESFLGKRTLNLANSLPKGPSMDLDFAFLDEKKQKKTIKFWEQYRNRFLSSFLGFPLKNWEFLKLHRNYEQLFYKYILLDYKRWIYGQLWCQKSKKVVTLRLYWYNIFFRHFQELWFDLDLIFCRFFPRQI